MSDVKLVDRNIKVEYPTGDAGEVTMARVANTLLAGIAFRADLRDKAMALEELNRPGLLIAPVAWTENFLFANLYEAGNVRQCLAEMSDREEDPEERRYGRYYAFALEGLNWKHLRYMARQMPELFPGATFHRTGDILPGTDEVDICEAENALSCIGLLAPFLGMPIPKRTAAE